MYFKVSNSGVNDGIYSLVETKIESQTNQQADYTFYSDIYAWKIIKSNSIDESYTLTFNTESNNHKIWPFIIEDNYYTPLIGTRSKENSTIIVKIPKEGKVALMMYQNDLKDIDNHWSKNTVETLVARQIINGYTDGTFRPNLSINRSEFTTMLIKSIEGVQENKTNVFQDVNQELWALPYITTAYNKGWIKGNGKQQFLPNDAITREQIITLLMRIYHDTEVVTVNTDHVYTYQDKDEISDYAIQYMDEALKVGLIEGYDNKLNPKGEATRAEAAVFINRFLELINRL